MDLPAPSGRRDNGLHSADWGALVDLDPRLSEALLSSLASADVPAFVEPAGGLKVSRSAAGTCGRGAAGAADAGADG